MGTYKSKAIKGDVYDLDPLEESPPSVQPLTRAPKPGQWKLNILRGKREDEIKDEAMPIARRKCRSKANKFIQCEQQNGKYWTVFECIEEYENMNECFLRELDIAADKLRRDLSRHPEWWWREFYDEDGEIGEQAQWKDEWWGELLFKKASNKIGSYFERSTVNNNNNSQSETKSADQK